MGGKRTSARLKAARKTSARKASPRKRPLKESTTAKSSAKKSTATRGAPKKAAATSGVVPTGQKLSRLVESMGNNWVAEMLQVSPSQPSRWRTGEEGISPENARQVTDLEYVMSRLLQLYTPSLAKIWLESYNANLGGRPVDVLLLRGALAVAATIDAEAQGAYA